MGQPATSAAQLLFIMSYFMGSALTEYAPLAADLLPADREPFEWEGMVDAALAQCSALEQAAHDADPAFVVHDELFETLLDEHHQHWDKVPTIRELRGGLFGVPDAVFGFWAYIFWLNAILVEFFDLLDSQPIREHGLHQVYEAVTAAHDDALWRLTNAVRRAIRSNSDLRDAPAQHLHVMANAWAVHWRAVVHDLAHTPLG